MTYFSKHFGKSRLFIIGDISYIRDSNDFDPLDDRKENVYGSELKFPTRFSIIRRYNGSIDFYVKTGDTVYDWKIVHKDEFYKRWESKRFDQKMEKLLNE